MTRDAIQTAVRQEDSSLVTQACPERSRMGHSSLAGASARRGFTLVELTIVLGIIIALSILTIPAFTSRRSADDLTKAANTIKGVLDQARAYAQANNTYTWVGFYEEDGSSPSVIPAPATCTGCAGRLVISVVASNDGTNLGAD